MATDPEPGRGFRLRVKSAAAAAYFAAMFFVAAPATILWLTRAKPFATAGTAAILAGSAIIAAANAFVFRLIGRFIREGDGTQVPIDPPRRFVAGGAYRYSRNPMYLAYLAIIAGEALVFGSAALVIYAAALWLVGHLYVTRREEPLLAARFGDAYREYCRRVPRWVGRSS